MDKQKLLKGVLIRNIIAALVVILGIIFLSDMPVFGVLLMVCGCVIFYLAFARRAKIMRSFCAKCSRHFDYEDDVAWEELKHYTEGDKTVKLKSKVAFKCYCRRCGNVASFTSTFTIASVDSNGNKKENNIRTLARRHFI